MRRWTKALALALALIGGAAVVPAYAQALSETREILSYKMKEGDTLIGLSQMHFVRPDAYLELLKGNQIKDPNRIGVGTVLQIPTSLLKKAPLTAKVVAFRGSVSVASKAPSLGMQVGEGAVIETAGDGYLTLALANGSRMSLPTNSRVRIEKLRKYTLTGGTDVDFAVDKGRTETSVTPQRDPRNRFRIRTPIAVSAVRGTVFRVGFDGPEKPSLTEVVEGNVLVNLAASGKSSAIPTGFGATAAQSGAFAKEELLPPPIIADAGLIQRGKRVAFNLVAVPEAVGYQVDVAADRQFTDLVASGRSGTNTVDIGALANGSYFVRAMAIASSGLVGLPQSGAFQRQINLMRAEPTAGGARRQRFSWGESAEKGAVYRLQLFGASSNGFPIIDETGLTETSLHVDGLRPGTYRWRVGTMRVSGAKAEMEWSPFEQVTTTE